jgi:hypothetical protein
MNEEFIMKYFVIKMNQPLNLDRLECIQEKCAWFMTIQNVCAINVLARIKY